MKFIREIRENLGLNHYKMSKAMNMRSVQEYIAFEDTKYSVNVKKLVKLWELSGLSARAFMELMRKEVSENQNK